MKITKKYKKIATFLIGCLTMITYSFRNLLYLILKGIRLWKKGYSSCFDEDYQQYTKHIIKYVNNHFNNDKVNLYEKNFFKQKVEKEYDFLFCYKSLHLNCNKHIPKERKMRKLLSSVKENALNYKLYPFLQYSNLNY